MVYYEKFQPGRTGKVMRMKEILLASDIGNVCIRIAPENFAGALGISERPEKFGDILRDYEWGIIADEQEFIRQLEIVFEGKFTGKEILDAFNSILVEPMPGMSELASEYSAMGVKPVFFSDISPTHLKETARLAPELYRNFAGGIFSFDAGAWKPSAAMLGRFEKLYGVPDLYVDDRLELVEAAREYGWHAIQFAGTEDLREKLLALS